MKKLLKKFAGFTTVLALLLSLMPTGVFADDTITNLGFGHENMIFSQTAEGETQYQIGSADPILYTGTIRLTGNGNVTILVESGEHDIILNGVTIDLSRSAGACAFEIKAGATANLIIENSFVLKSGSGKAGLQVNEGAILNLTGSGLIGPSYVHGGAGAAGIGGGNGGNAGTINISDISIREIIGGTGGAGIGGGDGGNGGNITISGSADIDKLQGGTDAAGIGGGNGGDGGTINISADVKAYAGVNAAGIGGGYGGDSGIINISAGTVTAIADSHALDSDPSNDEYAGAGGAGIGGGVGGSGNAITISGGDITATGGSGSAGIGGGGSSVGGNGGTINILGGTVTATGGGNSSLSAPGIGSGFGKNTGDVTISGGYVVATGNGSSGYRYGISSATFSTNYTKSDGTTVIGNAFIDVTGSVVDAVTGEHTFIYDTSGKAGWSGVIFEGNNGLVYGSPTISTNSIIETGKTLTIENDKTLTIAANTVLENYGTITNDGTLVGAGSLLDSGGTFQTNVLKAEYITGVNDRYVYKGSNVTVNHSITGPTFFGKVFNVIGWTGAIQKYDAGVWSTSAVDSVGDYRVIYTHSSSTAVTKEFTVAAPNTETDITALTIPNQVGTATIDATNHTVAITMPYGTDKTSLTPTITLSDGASVSPASGTAQDFTNAVSYTVTAENGTTTQNWIVIVTNEPLKITDGVNQSVQPGQSFSVTSNDDFTNFDRLEITLQGQTTPIVLLSAPQTSNENASVISGSIIATLNSTYTATLPVGIHTVTIHSTGGAATTQFAIVTATPVPVPSDPAISPLTGVYSTQTAENSNTTPFIALMLVSALGLTTLFLIRKKYMANQK